MMMLPGDALATRPLIACRDLLEVPCFPPPGLAEFDLLYGKWRFAQLCVTGRDTGLLRVPHGTTVRRPHAILRSPYAVLAGARRGGTGRLPAMPVRTRCRICSILLDGRLREARASARPSMRSGVWPLAGTADAQARAARAAPRACLLDRADHHPDSEEEHPRQDHGNDDPLGGAKGVVIAVDVRSGSGATDGAYPDGAYARDHRKLGHR